MFPNVQALPWKSPRPMLGRLLPDAIILIVVLYFISNMFVSSSIAWLTQPLAVLWIVEIAVYVIGLVLKTAGYKLGDFLLMVWAFGMLVFISLAVGAAYVIAYTAHSGYMFEVFSQYSSELTAPILVHFIGFVYCFVDRSKLSALLNEEMKVSSKA